MKRVVGVVWLGGCMGLEGLEGGRRKEDGIGIGMGNGINLLLYSNV